MPHPYHSFEHTSLWAAVEQAIDDLVENQDLSLTTTKAHVVGYLCQQLVSQATVVEDAFRSDTPREAISRRHLRSAQRAIRDVLMNDWDPIGVRDAKEAQGEYDAYVGPLFTLLATGPTEAAVADHLGHIAESAMGFSRRSDAETRTARALIALGLARKDHEAAT